MEIQDPGVSETVTEESMVDERPVRTINNMLDMDQLSDGRDQYAFGPLVLEVRSPPIDSPCSVSPSMRSSSFRY